MSWLSASVSLAVLVGVQWPLAGVLVCVPLRTGALSIFPWASMVSGGVRGAPAGSRGPSPGLSSAASSLGDLGQVPSPLLPHFLRCLLGVIMPLGAVVRMEAEVTVGRGFPAARPSCGRRYGSQEQQPPVPCAPSLPVDSAHPFHPCSLPTPTTRDQRQGQPTLIHLWPCQPAGHLHKHVCLIFCGAGRWLIHGEPSFLENHSPSLSSHPSLGPRPIWLLPRALLSCTGSATFPPSRPRTFESSWTARSRPHAVTQQVLWRLY